MGWHPDQVRTISISDFMAAFEGWRDAHVPETGGKGLSERERSELRSLMEEG